MEEKKKRFDQVLVNYRAALLLAVPPLRGQSRECCRRFIEDLEDQPLAVLVLRFS